MKESLTNRLSQDELHGLCALTQGEQNNHLKEELYQLTLDNDRRVAINALWTFTHFALQTMSGFMPSMTSLLTVA